MITEVKERQVIVGEGKFHFYATVRDGKVTAMSMPYRENYVSDISTICLQLYATFLNEILQAINDTKG